MSSFADLPTKVRLAARDVIDQAGGYIAGYYEGAVQVALPNTKEACDQLVAGLRAMGIEGEDRLTWFPLGSDNPPEYLRHFGIGTAACPRGDQPGYWKYRNFFVVA